MGKPTGNDLREGKVTLPLIYAMTRSDLPQHEAMQALIAKDALLPDDIDRLVEFAKTAGGIDHAYATMNRLRNQVA